ncbi:hypothetical protein CsatA_016628 [Cannabis sativa]
MVSSHPLKTIPLISHNSSHTIPYIYIMASSQKNCSFPCSFPRDAKLILSKSKRSAKEKASHRAIYTHEQILSKLGPYFQYDFLIHLKYPFAHLVPFRTALFTPKSIAHLFWYLTCLCTMAIEVQTMALHTAIQSFLEQEKNKPAYEIQMDILSWYAPLEEWQKILWDEWEKVRNNRHVFVYPSGPHVANMMDCYTVFFISLNATLDENKKIVCNPTFELYGSQEAPFREQDAEYRDLQKIIFEKNQTIPPEIWPRIEDDAPWEKFPSDYSRRIARALEKFQISENSHNQVQAPKAKKTNSSLFKETDTVGVLLRKTSIFEDSQDPYMDQEINQDSYLFQYNGLEWEIVYSDYDACPPAGSDEEDEPSGWHPLQEDPNYDSDYNADHEPIIDR